MTQILKVNLAHNMLRIYWQGHTKTMTHQEKWGQLRPRTDVCVQANGLREAAHRGEIEAEVTAGQPTPPPINTQNMKIGQL